MAGYSGTPLARKLGIAPGARLSAVTAPDTFVSELAPLPDGVSITPRFEPGADVTVLFVTTRAELESHATTVLRGLRPDAALWIAWPKKRSGMATDLTEDVLREAMLPTGVVDNKVCAIDETWSGLRFVWRKERRG